MTLDDILSLWEQDSKIDKTDISHESLKVPELHHKYIRIMSNESILLKKVETDYKNLYRLKWQYYSGSLDKETMQEYNWEPFRLKILKQDLPMYLESDRDLQALEAKITIQKEKTSVLESILKMIATRNYTIKNYIDFEKFQVGA